jgi:hypothetical protein
MSANINNNTATTNMSDVLPTMFRILDPEEVSQWEGYTATTLDNLAKYRDGVDRLEYTSG